MTFATQRTKRMLARRQTLHNANLAICFLVILFAIGYTLSNHLFDNISEMSAARSKHLVSYKITTGDTLWRIASKSITADEDVRDKIIAIQRLNNISATQTLSPGQIIKIPITKLTTDDFRYTFNHAVGTANNK